MPVTPVFIEQVGAGQSLTVEQLSQQFFRAEWSTLKKGGFRIQSAFSL
jgi:hypothetical protein